ncbi:MAG: hypothetical protein EHM41_05295 [Chloroflexi bacterium]|nr:MAG: hypothetical protein EHM41_05295 [Chloroflexota bacterium]
MLVKNCKDEQDVEKNWKRYILYLVLGFTILFLFGCGVNNPTVSPITTQEITASPQPTETPKPTVTPTPLPPLAILLAPEGSNPDLVVSISKLLEDQASRNGYRFEQRLQLTEDELGGVNFVVALPPYPELGALAASSHQTKFLAVGFNDLEPGENLSLVSTSTTAPEQQGFLAGYIAAVISSDWRVGVVSTSDTPSGTAARNGFLNGAVYYCGLCRPTYPPYYDAAGNILSYPTYVELPSDASPEEHLQAAQIMVDRHAEIVYVRSGAGSEELLQMLAEAGVTLIAESEPPAGTGSQWAATIQPGLLTAFEEVLAGLFEGRTGEKGLPVFELTHTNPDYLSQGKLDLIQRVSSDLIAGYIDPNPEPAAP